MAVSGHRPQPEVQCTESLSQGYFGKGTGSRCSNSIEGSYTGSVITGDYDSKKNRTDFGACGSGYESAVHATAGK